MSAISLVSVEDFDNEVDKDLVKFTGYFLQKTFPGYLWGVRLLATGMVGFTLGELMNYGDNHVMVVHPKDVPTMRSFEKILKKLGGELLERANLSREGSQNVAVTQRPEGFLEKFDSSIRLSKCAITKDNR